MLPRQSKPDSTSSTASLIQGFAGRSPFSAPYAQAEAVNGLCFATDQVQ